MSKSPKTEATSSPLRPFLDAGDTTAWPEKEQKLKIEKNGTG
jgi:hypothetical protein